jgi:hypothetical protein
VRLTAAVVLAMSALGCAPNAEQCALLFPRPVEGAAAARTPAGSGGCSGLVDEVPVSVEARRQLLGFERGRLFVEDREVELADFDREVRHARLRRAGKEIGESARDALDRAAGAVEGFLEGLAGEQQDDGQEDGGADEGSEEEDAPR